MCEDCIFAMAHFEILQEKQVNFQFSDMIVQNPAASSQHCTTCYSNTRVK